MRAVMPFALAAVLAGCSYGPPPPPGPMIPDARAQARLAQLLDGKVAGAPQPCLPSYRADRMEVVDDYTIAFRDGPGRVWVTRPAGGCNMLSSGPYALVLRRTTSSLCRGDIGEVSDTLSHVTVGSCVIGDFVPYTRPR